MGLAAYASCVVALAYMLRGSSWRWGVLLFALPMLAGFGWRLYGLSLLAFAKVCWPSGRKGLLIYSDSPRWKEYIESEWLPRLGSYVVVLNWSCHKTWRASLAVKLFRFFVGTTHNFNPAVLVLRGLRAPLVFRFFYAFRDAKHGDHSALARLQSRLFVELP